MFSVQAIRVAIIVFALLSVTRSAPVTVLLQNGLNNYSGTTDRELRYQSSPFSDTGIIVEEMCPYCPKARMVIRFDLSSIPTDAVVSQATLSMYEFFSWGEGASGDFTAHRVTRTWDPAVANWIAAAPGVRWSTEGGDFDPGVVGRFSMSGSSGQWITVNVQTAVQAFIRSPTANYGVLIRNTVGVRGPIFNASESGNLSRRPKLLITYESTTAVRERLVPVQPTVAAATAHSRIIALDGRILPARSVLSGVFIGFPSGRTNTDDGALRVRIDGAGTAK